MPNPLAGIYNFSTPDWRPLERAARAYSVKMKSVQPIIGDFMWMCENPAGVHQYKHCQTRNYAIIRSDSTNAECVAQIEKALSFERTWGKTLEEESDLERARR